MSFQISALPWRDFYFSLLNKQGSRPMVIWNARAVNSTAAAGCVPSVSDHEMTIVIW